MARDNANKHTRLRRDTSVQAAGISGMEAVEVSGIRCYENYNPPYSVVFFPNENPQKIRYIGSNMEYEAEGRKLEKCFEEIAAGKLTLLRPSEKEPDDPEGYYIASVRINYRTI